MIDMTIAIVVAAISLALWLGFMLYSAHERIEKVLQERDDSRQYADSLVKLLTPPAFPLPEIYTPEQMEQRERARYIAQTDQLKRRWHEQDKDVDRALKWDDTWGPQ